MIRGRVAPGFEDVEAEFRTSFFERGEPVFLACVIRVFGHLLHRESGTVYIVIDYLKIAVIFVIVFFEFFGFQCLGKAEILESSHEFVESEFFGFFFALFSLPFL